MWTQFGDLSRTFSVMDELRRRMDRVWDDFDSYGSPRTEEGFASVAWPKLNVYDAGSNLILKADVPGMSENDLQLSLNADSLSISGERTVEVPEGYSAHRQERSAVKFSRSLMLPCKVDSEHTSASVKDGVLTITLAKAPEAQPRQITVRAQ
jgi:HSP20 family protein